MSRAKAVADRIENDAYQTPLALAKAIVGYLADDVLSLTPEYIIEPSAGTGAFVKAAGEQWRNAEIQAVEVDSSRYALLNDLGAKTYLGTWESYLSVFTRGEGHLLILGNPPYRLAREHVLASLDWMRNGDMLAFLLRLNFLGSLSRVHLWRRDGLVSVTPIVPRPSFTGGGSDATEYALFVWCKGYDGAAELCKPLTWSKARKAA